MCKTRLGDHLPIGTKLYRKTELMFCHLKGRKIQRNHRHRRPKIYCPNADNA